MNYTKIEIQVPEGYEDQVKEHAMLKVKSIISQLKLKPTTAMRNSFNTEYDKAKNLNKIT